MTPRSKTVAFAVVLCLVAAGAWLWMATRPEMMVQLSIVRVESSPGHPVWSEDDVRYVHPALEAALAEAALHGGASIRLPETDRKALQERWTEVAGASGTRSPFSYKGTSFSMALAI